jgi:hypothetical protein
MKSVPLTRAAFHLDHATATRMQQENALAA